MTIVSGVCKYQAALVEVIRREADSALTLLPRGPKMLVIDYAIEPSCCRTVTEMEKSANQTVSVAMGFLSRCGFAKGDRLILRREHAPSYARVADTDQIPDLEIIQKVCLVAWRDTLYFQVKDSSFSRDVPPTFKEQICFHAIALCVTYRPALAERFNPASKPSLPDIAEENQEALRKQIQQDLGAAAKEIVASAHLRVMLALANGASSAT